MNLYEVKTIFPVDESIDGKKHITRKQVNVDSDVEVKDVIELYNSYRRGGFKVRASFIAPPEKEQGNNDEVSPFDVAKSLTKQGIGYKASLKIKSKGEYDDMLEVMHLVESEGFDMTVTATLKVTDKTSINIDDSDSWVGEDAKYKVTPRGTVKNVYELKALYTALDKKGYEVEIKITPQTPKENDMDNETNSFKNQLVAYPDGTLVTFHLENDI